MDTQQLQLTTFKARLAYLSALLNKAVERDLDLSERNVAQNTAIKKQILLPAQTLIQEMMQDVTSANQRASQAQSKTTFELEL